MLEVPTNRRARDLNDRPHGSGPAVYWMSRDQRAGDNWALLHAAALAANKGQPLIVAFCLMPRLGQASRAHYEFMLAGLRETAETLAGRGIAFELMIGDPVTEVTALVSKIGAGLVVCDFSPLRGARRRRSVLASRLGVRMVEVDAHNVVPAWLASDKREPAAHTMRRKLERLLPDWLEEMPKLDDAAVPATSVGESDWSAAELAVQACGTQTTLPVEPGARAARAALSQFLDTGLADYAERRNDPNAGAQSGLSPYLHFGQLAPQRAALEAWRLRDLAGAGDFLDELVTWREVAENNCLHNPEYGRIAGLSGWAQATLDDHRRDPREFLYEFDKFEQARTHDELWNAAQLEMVHTGRMHGYMRMYWAKKILEWTASPEQALRFTSVLNDRYSLDGRDPNGYIGIDWAIGGTLDRPWREREVYGKIRYMNERGARRKFDVDRYVARVYELAGRPAAGDRLFD